jgi:hypothetical protein
MSAAESVSSLIGTLADVLKKGMAVSEEERKKNDETAKKAKLDESFKQFVNAKYALTVPTGTTYILNFRAIPDEDENDTIYFATMTMDSHKITCTNIVVSMKDNVAHNLKFSFASPFTNQNVHMNIIFGASGVVSGSCHGDCNGTVVGSKLP